MQIINKLRALNDVTNNCINTQYSDIGVSLRRGLGKLSQYYDDYPPEGQKLIDDMWNLIPNLEKQVEVIYGKYGQLCGMTRSEVEEALDYVNKGQQV